MLASLIATNVGSSAPPIRTAMSKPWRSRSTTWSFKSNDTFTFGLFATNDGPVKGFVNPDFNGNGQLYFTTTNKVWALHDNGATANIVWVGAGFKDLTVG